MFDPMNHDVICSSCLRAPLQSKKKYSTLLIFESIWQACRNWIVFLIKSVLGPLMNQFFVKVVSQTDEFCGGSLNSDGLSSV